MISLLACFTLLSFAARVDFVDGALPCTSRLRTRYPQLFPHCPKCSYTQWTAWSVVIPVEIRTEASCDSAKAKKYERTRTPLPGAVCEDALQRNITYKCVPTLRQQAELFIRSLRLGANAEEPTANPATTPTIPTTRPMRPTTWPTRPTRPTTWPTRPTRPTTRPTRPTTRPTRPTTRPTRPTTRPTRPTTRPTRPTTRPTRPTTRPTRPTTRPTRPTTRPTRPTTRPTRPTTRPTRPTTRPTRPTTRPTRPTTRPTRPTTRPTRPTTRPTRPTTRPTRPTTRPTRPTTRPTRPTTRPTRPTTRPTRPTTRPTRPTIWPTRPTRPTTLPTRPTRPTTRPTRPTTRPTRPTTRPTRPTTRPTRPTTRPTRPTIWPTWPSGPTRPTTRPTRPTTRPTCPTTRPKPVIIKSTPPTTRPTPPTTRPTPPTNRSIRSTALLICLSTWSTRPTTRYTRPTAWPTRPTRPTTRYTRPTAWPTWPTRRTTRPTRSNTWPTRPTTRPTHSTTRPKRRSTWPTRPTTRPTHPTILPLHPTTQPTYQFPKRKKQFLYTDPTQRLTTTSPPFVSFTVSPTLFTTQLRTSHPTTFSQYPFLFRGRRQVPIPAGSEYCPSPKGQANNRICPNVCLRGKRSIAERSPTESLQENLQNVTEETDVPVVPFNMEEVVGAIHARRRRQICPDSSTQPAQERIRYVLFILDTSGSIGSVHFQEVKQILADLSATLCDHLQVALLTYSSNFNLEFCFNCYNNSNDIFDAIMNTRYRGGITRTTAATKCACSTLLTTQCGLPYGVYTPNIDVVYLTDGKHNGRCTGTSLTDELDCFHSDNRPNINTYAIGIGRASLDSVNAIAKVRDPNDAHVFNVDTFEDLKVLFSIILDLLTTDDDNDGVPDFSCISHDATPCKG